MINILKSLIAIFLVVLLFSACDSEPQVQVELQPFRNTNYPQIIHHSLIVTVLKDNLEIKDIIVNNKVEDCDHKGYIKFSDSKVNKLPAILNSYQSMTITFLSCRVKKVDILTNQGDWSFEFK
ncbi:hypothetical protein ACNSOS_11085 [Aliarcobacter vitoriensis]|uniref:hypothetical protein n=1 Tax=Aliarcobacter vitoriensis TaxID=2011099 RepID=UPI003AB10259